MYKYLFWDIDGTVLYFLAAERAALKALFPKFGLGECTDEMHLIYSAINTSHWEMLERGEASREEIIVHRYKEFFEQMGLDVSKAEAFNEAYEYSLGTYAHFMPYAKEVLEAQKAGGKYKLIAVTNGSRDVQVRKLSLSGLDQIFDSVYISQDVGYEKPSKAFFDYVFEREGIEDPKEALIIGDSLSSYMRGGLTSGIDTCWYNPGHKPNDKGINVTYEINDLRQVPGITGLG